MMEVAYQPSMLDTAVLEGPSLGVGEQRQAQRLVRRVAGDGAGAGGQERVSA